MTSTKPIHLSKAVVVKAYKLVKSNAGAAGVDQQTLQDFDQKLEKNLYKIWNRLSSGSYFPPPVKQVGIPKKSGGMRYLGIPTVSDRIAQMTIKLLIEPLWEPLFHADSYGYRPHKSALQAVEVTRKRCWTYDWLVEFDIKGAFDNIDHALLLKAVRKHTPETWQVMYIERWLTAPIETSDGLADRACGIPQGGVISPLLMNLFMHYTFDCWMDRDHAELPFARYADDAVVHCHSRAEAEAVLSSIARRLEACGLQMHPEKSGIVYCKDGSRRGDFEQTQFTFLGFTFCARVAVRKDGSTFTGFLPAVSKEACAAMRSRIRSWRLHRRTSVSLGRLLAAHRRVLSGWLNYYGRFYRSALSSVFNYYYHRLLSWVRRKYRRFRGRIIASQLWLERIRAALPHLFVGGDAFVISGYR